MAMTAPEKRGAAHDNRGFSLVELLMVIAIIGVLSLMAIPQYSNLKNRAQNSRCKSEIRTVEKSIIAYNLDHGSFPTTGNLSLATTTLKDPWGRDYQYYNINGGAGTPYMNVNGIDPLNTDFDLYSLGVDGATTAKLDPASTTSMDDIVRGTNGSIVSLGRNY